MLPAHSVWCRTGRSSCNHPLNLRLPRAGRHPLLIFLLSLTILHRRRSGGRTSSRSRSCSRYSRSAASSSSNCTSKRSDSYSTSSEHIYTRRENSHLEPRVPVETRPPTMLRSTSVPCPGDPGCCHTNHCGQRAQVAPTHRVTRFGSKRA